VDFQDFAAPAHVGRADEDFAVERPGRRNAGSTASIRLVVPPRSRRRRGLSPSISAAVASRAGVGMRAGLAALGRHRVEFVDER